MIGLESHAEHDKIDVYERYHYHIDPPDRRSHKAWLLADSLLIFPLTFFGNVVRLCVYKATPPIRRRRFLFCTRCANLRPGG